MASTSEDLTVIDGSLDWSGGVDSDRVTTLQSTLNTNGLPRNMLAWLVNGTVRGGGIQPFPGWQNRGTMIPSPGFYQGGTLYEPVNANPYLMFLMDGHLFAVLDPNNPGSVTDLSTQFSLFMPSGVMQAFFCQAEEFLVIQAGDYLLNPPGTLPLFWDGTTLKRSKGIISALNIPGSLSPYNQIPSAGPMCYYMGRLWYAQGRQYSAGDIVGGSAGTALYKERDSVLYVTENPLCLGGDGFTVPSVAGNIKAIAYAANLNSQLGQGTLYIFTRNQIYALQVPVTRNDWISADSKNMPLQYAVQITTGAVSDRCIVEVNSDLFFQTLQPSIQSLQSAIRNFNQWGSVPVSINVQRALALNDRSLLWAASGIYFDNRVLQTASPEMTPFGVTHSALVPLNFDTISSFNSTLSPAWEGMLTGLDILELFEGDFGGLQRAFALIISRKDQTLQLYELSLGALRNPGDVHIPWVVEFPAYTWGQEFQLKEMMTLELWLDSVVGEVNFTLDYRPDSDQCFYPWLSWKVCAARNQAETIPPTASAYPAAYGPGYKSTITLPHPPQQCNAMTGRPAYIGYQFQPRLRVSGSCRIRGLFLHGAKRMRQLYENSVCPQMGAVVMIK